jgi:hypothetical protein
VIGPRHVVASKHQLLHRQPGAVIGGVGCIGARRVFERASDSGIG